MSRCPFPLLAAFVLVTTVGCAAGAREPLHPCAWCGAMDAPPDDQLTWWMQIAGDDEPGQRIVLRGRVFMPDGETPAPDVLVYAYQTDVTGEYRMEGGETGNGRRHGALRGWLRTDSDGRYEIRTIKPGAYPTRTEPAHVHVTLTPRVGEERWVDTYWFEGDPLITDRARRVLRDTGRFAGIVRLEADDDGVLVAERDLLLRQ